MQLNPNDPVEAVLAEMAETNRRKRHDYTIDPDGNPFGNFEETARDVGVSVLKVIKMNVFQKVARWRALEQTGRTPRNEPLVDTIQDLAVYLVIYLARHRQEQLHAAGAAPTAALTALPAVLDRSS